MQAISFGINSLLKWTLLEHRSFPSQLRLPFYDVSVWSRFVDQSTREVRTAGYGLINSALDYAINNRNVKVVVLAHHPYCSIASGDVIDVNNANEKDIYKIIRTSMDTTFKKLVESGKQVIYVKDNPSFKFDIRTCKERPFRLTENYARAKCSEPRTEFDATDGPNSKFNKILDEEVKKYPQIMVFDASSVLCDDKVCWAAHDGDVLYRDDSHLSYSGSAYVRRFSPNDSGRAVKITKPPTLFSVFSFQLPSHPRLRIKAHPARNGSRTEKGLRLLVVSP